MLGKTFTGEDWRRLMRLKEESTVEVIPVAGITFHQKELKTAMTGAPSAPRLPSSGKCRLRRMRCPSSGGVRGGTAMSPRCSPRRGESSAPPPAEGGVVFTADVRLTPQDGGTHYEVTLSHARAEDARAHAAMGFDQGWGTAAEPLGALATGL